MSRARKIHIRWLAEFCVIENFQFQRNETYDLPADWQGWAADMRDSKRLEILDRPEEIKEEEVNNDAKK